MIALLVGCLTLCWSADANRTEGRSLLGEGAVAVKGRVVDEAGTPVAGARVRLYVRTGRWERKHPLIEETTAATDGTFHLKSALKPIPLSRSRGLAPYVLLADHPGKALGWRNIPATATSFEADITLTGPGERSILVVDQGGRGIPDAKVLAYGVGDMASPSPLFADVLELLRTDDGPLTALTGGDGRAVFKSLPRTKAAFLAEKSGFAENYAFDDQSTIHLSPAARLSGRVTGPKGTPLAGIKVVLHPDFMWHFDYAVSNAQGVYRFDDLKGRGWDMSAWGKGKTANGSYKVWIESERFATPTLFATLDSGVDQTMNIEASEAGVIRVTLLEEGTNKPVPGARIWGMAPNTGSERFNAYTDERGQATFYTVPDRVSFSLAGPPDGFYIIGALQNDQGSTKTIDFEGGAVDLTMTMPPIAGRVITVSGICSKPDGSPAAGASVHPTASGEFLSSSSMNYIHERTTDSKGRFTLNGVPSGQTLLIYAETENRDFASTVSFKAPNKDEPGFEARISLRPTVEVDLEVVGSQGKPLASRAFHISPRGDKRDFPFCRRDVKSDEKGHVWIDGILPGLAYHIEEDVPPREGPIAVRAGGKLPWFDEILVLAPEANK